MKKIFLTTIILCAAVFAAFAQDEYEERKSKDQVPLTKNGYKILPEKGDYGISIGATQFINFFGQMLSSGATAPRFGDGVALSGHYFLEKNISIRATLSLGLGKDIYKGTIQDDFAASQPGYNGHTVIDVMETKNTNVDIEAAFLFHRGYRRLQGYYGGQINFDFNNSKDVYTWANPMTIDNQAPTSVTNFSDVANFGSAVMAGALGNRTLEVKSGNKFGIGIGVLAGVEYFFAPKMSLGGEFGLGLNISNRWQGEATTESFDTVENVVRVDSERVLNGNTGGINLETYANGRLMLNFYF
jgi:hypothetical protein